MLLSSSTVRSRCSCVVEGVSCVPRVVVSALEFAAGAVSTEIIVSRVLLEAMSGEKFLAGVEPRISLFGLGLLMIMGDLSVGGVSRTITILGLSLQMIIGGSFDVTTSL